MYYYWLEVVYFVYFISGLNISVLYDKSFKRTVSNKRMK